MIITLRILFTAPIPQPNNLTFTPNPINVIFSPNPKTMSHHANDPNLTVSKTHNAKSMHQMQFTIKNDSNTNQTNSTTYSNNINYSTQSSLPHYSQNLSNTQIKREADKIIRQIFVPTSPTDNTNNNINNVNNNDNTVNIPPPFESHPAVNHIKFAILNQSPNQNQL